MTTEIYELKLKYQFAPSKHLEQNYLTFYDESNSIYYIYIRDQEIKVKMTKKRLSDFFFAFFRFCQSLNGLFKAFKRQENIFHEFFFSKLKKKFKYKQQSIAILYFKNIVKVIKKQKKKNNWKVKFKKSSKNYIFFSMEKIKITPPFFFHKKLS